MSAAVPDVHVRLNSGSVGGTGGGLGAAIWAGADSSSRPGLPVCSQHLRHGRFGRLSLFNDHAQTIAQGYDIV